MSTNGNSSRTRFSGTDMIALEAFELYRFYHSGDDETAALRGVSLQLQAGEFVALMGPSGSGKSTLLACLAGLDEPDGGHVEVMGLRLSHRTEAIRSALRAQHIGIMMQSGNLFGHLTVEDNMRLQMSLAGKSDPSRIDHLLQKMGIENRRLARPFQLSGGEAARAGLAVALSADPQVLLADEPTAEVDKATEANILKLLRDLCREGTAILVATHSQTLASTSDKVLHIQDGRLIHD